MQGVPARQVGWMSSHGHVLSKEKDGKIICQESGYKYVIKDNNLYCEDLNEMKDISYELSVGERDYRQFKQ